MPLRGNWARCLKDISISMFRQFIQLFPKKLLRLGDFLLPTTSFTLTVELQQWRSICLRPLIFHAKQASTGNGFSTSIFWHSSSSSYSNRFKRRIKRRGREWRRSSWMHARNFLRQRMRAAPASSDRIILLTGSSFLIRHNDNICLFLGNMTMMMTPNALAMGSKVEFLSQLQVECCCRLLTIYRKRSGLTESATCW